MSLKLSIIGIALSALIFVSCKKDFYDLTPYNALPLNDAIKTEGDLLTVNLGLYQDLRNVDLFGRSLPVKGDLMADNVYIKSNNSGRYLRFNNYDMIITDGNALGTWTAGYNTILRANTIINANLPASANVSQLKGEAYAIRALAYFELVKNFSKPYSVDPNAAGVPIVTTFDQSLKPTRNTVKEVYDLINADLNQAYTLMTFNIGGTLSIPSTGQSRVYNSSYITKFGAKALQARVYQNIGDWTNAKTAALDVFTNAGFTLVDSAGYVNYWKNPTPLSSKLETIFEVSSDIAGNLGTDALAYMYDQAGYGDLLVTTDLYSQYRTGDVRRNVINTGILGGNTVYIANKYSNTSNASEKDDTKIIRFSDIVLILAEAYAKTSDEPNALLRLNQVAQRREPSFAGYSSTGSTLINDIIGERRKEFAFEGLRFWDFQRLNLSFTHIKTQFPTTTLVVDPSNDRRIFPIPQAEADANPNIKPQQNPGY